MKTNTMLKFLEDDFLINEEIDKNKKTLARKIIKLHKANEINIEEVINYDAEQFKKILELLMPTSLVDLSNSIYRLNEVLKAYAISNEGEYTNTSLINIDKESFWFELKNRYELKRYFSDKQYRKIITELNKETLFDGNSLYYKTLFMAIYEGMYNKNLTEIKNLRLSDVNMETNIVTLRDDELNVRTLQISDELKDNLVKTSEINVWYKKVGRASLPTGQYIGGQYDDSVFKILSYNNRDIAKSYKEFYYRRLKTICEEFLDYNTSPMQIYVSGIINRVYVRLKDMGVTLEDMRTEKNNFSMATKFFISRECSRVNYNVNMNNFMRVLRSYADIFDDNIK